MATIRLITERWLNDRKNTLNITRGDEAKATIEAEIAEAQKHFDARCAVEVLAKKQGFRPNSYEGKCQVSGQQVKPSCGLVRKNDAGKWDTYSFAAVQEIVGYQFEG